MSNDTTFVDGTTLTVAAWFQDQNDQVFKNAGVCYLTGVAGTNTITGTSSPTQTAYKARQVFWFIPAVTNTGATTLAVDSLGAKNVFCAGAACTGGEIRASIPIAVIYDGTQFNLIGPSSGAGLWTTPAFSAGDYTANASMTWGVGSGDVTTNEATIVNKMMTMNFNLVTTTVGGTPDAELRIAVTGGKTIAKTVTVPNLVYYDNATTAGIGSITASAGLTYIALQRSTGFGAGTNWSLATNTTAVSGSITFEIS